MGWRVVVAGILWVLRVCATQRLNKITLLHIFAVNIRLNVQTSYCVFLTLTVSSFYFIILLLLL